MDMGLGSCGNRIRWSVDAKIAWNLVLRRGHGSLSANLLLLLFVVRFARAPSLSLRVMQYDLRNFSQSVEYRGNLIFNESLAEGFCLLMGPDA